MLLVEAGARLIFARFGRVVEYVAWAGGVFDDEDDADEAGLEGEDGAGHGGEVGEG